MELSRSASFRDSSTAQEISQSALSELDLHFFHLSTVPNYPQLHFFQKTSVMRYPEVGTQQEIHLIFLHTSFHTREQEIFVYPVSHTWQY